MPLLSPHPPGVHREQTVKSARWVICSDSGLSEMAVSDGDTQVTRTAVLPCGFTRLSQQMIEVSISRVGVGAVSLVGKVDRFSGTSLSL